MWRRKRLLLRATHYYIYPRLRKPAKGRALKIARPVETVRAYLALGQAYGFDEVFHRVEAQRRQPEVLSYYLYHLLVFGRIGRGVSLEVLVLISFKVFYYAARYELEIAFRRCETYERATVNQRRA